MSLVDITRAGVSQSKPGTEVVGSAHGERLKARRAKGGTNTDVAVKSLGASERVHGRKQRKCIPDSKRDDTLIC